MTLKFPVTALLAAAVFLSSCSSNGESRTRNAMPMSPNQQVAPPIALLFAGLDADLDTLVSASEIEAAIPLMFSQSDTDGDGALSGVEFSSWSGAHMGSRDTTPGRLRFDQNQNNQISLAEFEATLLAMLTRFDRNRDGALARDELLMTLTAPDTSAMRAQMESEMRRRAQQICRQSRG